MIRCAVVVSRTAAIAALLVAPLLGLAERASAQDTTVAVESAPRGVAYAPTGYSLVVPSPQTLPTGTHAVAARRATSETQTVRGLWIPGLVGLPVSYVTTWMVASVTLSPGTGAVDLAYVPVLGPWLMLGQGLNGGGEEFYATMGVVQGVSLVCLVLGLAIRLPRPPEGVAVSLRPGNGGGMSATVDF